MAGEQRSGPGSFGSTTPRRAWRIEPATTAEPRIAQRRVQGDEQAGELLASGRGAGRRSARADDVEVRVVRGVLASGGTWPRLCVEGRAAERPAGPGVSSDGTEVAYHDRRPVTDLSVFGQLVFERHAFAAPGQAMVDPLDAELSLPERCSSELPRA